MKIKLLISAILCMASLLNAQTTAVKWVKTYGGNTVEVGTDITTDPAGNTYTVGAYAGTVDFDPGSGVTSLTANGGYDLFISKLDASGNFVWVKSIGGGMTDVANAIAIDKLGNLYITGLFEDTVDFDPGAGVMELAAVAQDIFIAKLSSQGKFIWAKKIGGDYMDYGRSIAVNESGAYITGNFTGTVDFDPGLDTTEVTAVGNFMGIDIFISKLDTAGNFIWAKNLGSEHEDHGNDIALDAAGNVYITGSFISAAYFDTALGFNNVLVGNGSEDVFILKLNPSGKFLWSRALGGPYEEYAASVAVDASGSVYTTGNYIGTADFDPSAGTFILSTETGLSRDAFISKLDSAGKFVWAKRLGGDGGVFGASVVVDAQRNVYTTGRFTKTTDFDPGPGVVNLTAVWSFDVYVSKLDMLGNFVWAKAFGGELDDIGNAVALDNLGYVYTTGSFSDKVNFNPGDKDSLPRTSAGKEDVFVHKMNTAGSSEIEDSFVFKTKCTIYLNPADGLIRVVMPDLAAGARVEIYNSLGALIYHQVIVNEVTAVNLSNHPGGLYVVRVVSDHEIVSTGKIIKL